MAQGFGQAGRLRKQPTGNFLVQNEMTRFLFELAPQVGLTYRYEHTAREYCIPRKRPYFDHKHIVILRRGTPSNPNDHNVLCLTLIDNEDKKPTSWCTQIAFNIFIRKDENGFGHTFLLPGVSSGCPEFVHHYIGWSVTFITYTVFNVATTHNWNMKIDNQKFDLEQIVPVFVAQALCTFLNPKQ